jgi:hypothetical protein
MGMEAGGVKANHVILGEFGDPISSLAWETFPTPSDDRPPQPFREKPWGNTRKF